MEEAKVLSLAEWLRTEAGQRQWLVGYNGAIDVTTSTISNSL